VLENLRAPYTGRSRRGQDKIARRGAIDLGVLWWASPFQTGIHDLPRTAPGQTGHPGPGVADLRRAGRPRLLRSDAGAVIKPDPAELAKLSLAAR